MSRPGIRASALYAIFFLSGMAGLGCQMVWLRMFATGLGHEMPAVLAVTCAVMGGMGLGAWVFDRAISRSGKPAAWYAGLEVAIGAWGLVSTFLIPLANKAALGLLGVEPSPFRHWAVEFLLPTVSVLPATAAMGATFPAMERFAAPFFENRRCVGGIYAANTFGAVAGVLLSALVISPAIGLQASVWGFALINFVCSALAMGFWKFGLGEQMVNPVARVSKPARQASFSISPRRLNISVLCAGLLGIGYETAGIRVLSQVLENTVYTFAAVLAVFLLGTSLGAAAYQRYGQRLGSRLLASELSISCLIGVLVLARAQQLYDASRSLLGDSPSGVFVAELGVAVAVFALPTFFMGTVFSQLVQAAQSDKGGAGRAMALNTFGGALAPAVFGVILLSALGSKWTLVLMSLGYLALLPQLGRWRWRASVLALVLFFVWPVDLRIVRLGSEDKVADFREGIMGTVAVVEDRAANKSLRVNNRFQMGGTGSAEAEYRHAHIPLLLHPSPRRALFLGLGTGITFGAASLYPNLESDGVELVPEVVAVMPEFEPYNFSATHHPGLSVHVADARRFVRATNARYDVIVADLFHPARDGAGSLYTLEHFKAVRERLAPGGIFCQWLPLHQLDERMLEIIIRTFMEVFPDTQAYLLRFNIDAPVVGLMGSVRWPEYSTDWVEKHSASRELEGQLKKLVLADSLRFFGNLLAGPKELREFTGDAPLNTDDHPRITFGAPRFTYLKGADSYGRLLAMLQHPVSDLTSALKLPRDAQNDRFVARLGAFIKARDVYLTGLVAQLEGRLDKALDAFVESARLSEDFTAGYAQCLSLAAIQAKAHPEQARALLQRLVEAQPSRPVAAELLKRLTSRESRE